MSVFGGDSWAREAQHRKRRVDDLLLSSAAAVPATSFKKLSNGKYACLVCPGRPVVDSPLQLSMHNKGSRHIAAESRLREREKCRQEEFDKRIALSSDSTGMPNCSTSRNGGKYLEIQKRSLTEQTKTVILKTQSALSQNPIARNCGHNVLHGVHYSLCAFCLPPAGDQTIKAPQSGGVEANCSDKSGMGAAEATSEMHAIHSSEFHRRCEKELKFVAAGWKRDCHGKWYRDETVEFDSDEEDPNVCLN